MKVLVNPSKGKNENFNLQNYSFDSDNDTYRISKS